VTSGWLDALVSLLRARPEAGAAGSRLVYPDGTLQEAGGIIWKDGSGWNYGRGDNPAKPVYNYVREVDYCSAASLIVRRQVFEMLGGFDASFAPAYYEDVDLAFRIRRRGFQVWYQPRSRVIHLEGVSHGTDTGAGVKRNQLVNQGRFVQRWGPTLTAEHLSSGQRVMRARDRARFRPVVLVIDHYVPEPDRDAGSCNILNYIRAMLASGAAVKFWPHDRRYSPGYTEALQDAGVEARSHRPISDCSNRTARRGLFTIVSICIFAGSGCRLKRQATRRLPVRRTRSSDWSGGSGVVRM
jgi:hypothetical protein